MRRFAQSVLLAAPLICWRANAHAADRGAIGLAASLGYSYPGQNGFGMTAGLWARRWYLLGFGSLDFTIVRGPPNERYREETFENGRTVCRDHSDGQFAKDENCGSTETLLGAMAELHVTPLAGAFIGGGVRTAPASGPYAAAGYGGRITTTAARLWFIRGALGSHFGQLHLGVGF